MTNPYGNALSLQKSTAIPSMEVVCGETNTTGVGVGVGVGVEVVVSDAEIDGVKLPEAVNDAETDGNKTEGVRDSLDDASGEGESEAENEEERAGPETDAVGELEAATLDVMELVGETEGLKGAGVAV